MYSCKFCDKTFTNYRSLNGHQRVHNDNGGRYSVPRIQKNSVNEVERQCLDCSATFVDYENSPKKFCSLSCHHSFQWKTTSIPKIEKGLCSDRRIQAKYLTDRDGYACKACGIEDWQGQPLSLDVDHIDGDPTNNFPDNLRFLCPNCHRQTDSWGNCAAKRASKNGRGHAGIDIRKLKS